MTAMASIATKAPNLVRDLFLEYSKDKGIYNVRFFIRGKPWVVTVDDYLLFEKD